MKAIDSFHRFAVPLPRRGRLGNEASRVPSSLVPNYVDRGDAIAPVPSGVRGPRVGVSTNETHTDTFPPISFGVNVSLSIIPLVESSWDSKDLLPRRSLAGCGAAPHGNGDTYTKNYDEPKYANAKTPK